MKREFRSTQKFAPVICAVLLFPLLLLLGNCGSEPSQEEINKVLLSKSKSIAQEFASTLKSELQQALQKSGPVGAIEVCKKVSVKTEEKFQEQYPDIVRLRRISLKTRNPEIHTPTPEEKKWLEETSFVMQGGSKPVAGILGGEEKKTVLLPIVIKEGVCLMCHGPKDMLDEQLIEALQKHYPNDQATGYQIGDLRGAISIQWQL